MLKTRKLERIVKGFANHRRIEILELVFSKPDLSLQDIASTLRINMKTASEHTRRLTISGLVYKHNKGSSVLHQASPLGVDILKFLRKLD